MRKIIYTPQPALIAWVCGQLDIPSPGPCSAIGIMGTNSIIGGALFNNMHLDMAGKPLSIEISFATVDKRWCSRDNIITILSYPFAQLGVKRVQATVAKRNMPVRFFLERLGFKFEGIARLAWPKGGDAACYSLLRHECKWLSGENFGKISTIGTGSAGPQRGERGPNGQQSTNSALQLRSEQSQHHISLGKPQLHNGHLKS